MLGFHALGQQALGGLTSSILVDYSLTCAAGSFTISGQAAGVRATRKLTAAAASYAVTGQNALLIQTYPNLTAAAGAVTISGQAASFKWAHSLVGAAGTYSIGGQTSRLRFAHRIVAAASTYTITGQNAGLRPAWKLSIGSPGSYSITGQPATFKVNMPASAGSYQITGQSVTLRVNMPAAAAAYAIAGQNAITLAQFVLHASELPIPSVYRRQFGFAALGEAALGEHDYIETPTVTYRVLGKSAEFRVARVRGEAGAYVASGQDSILRPHYVLRAGVAYVVTGGAVQFSYIRRRVVGQFMGGLSTLGAIAGGPKIRGF